MRVLALDLGERRIGVALSDSSGTLASPYAVIERSGDPDHDRARLVALVAETGAGRIIVGLPLSLSGHEGPAAVAARREADSIRLALSVPVETVDERLTTVEAARRRRERSTADGEPRRRRRSRHRKGSSAIDAEAAAIILEAWLSARREAR